MLQANVSRLGLPPSPEASEDRPARRPKPLGGVPKFLAKGDRVSGLKSRHGIFVPSEMDF
jgi:hypothetical protein